MAYVNVAEWSSDQVVEWMRGLEDCLSVYADNIHSNNVNGRRLLQLTPDLMPALGIIKIGHQELLLQAVAQLRNIHYHLDQETLQQLSLRLSSKARSVYNELRTPATGGGGSAGEDDASATDDDDTPGDSSAGSVVSKGGHGKQCLVSTSIVAGVADCLTTVKTIVSWLNRPPFDGVSLFEKRKEELVEISIKLATIGQRDFFAENQGTVIRDNCKELAEIADDIIQNYKDPLIIQPASLDVATIKKKPDDDLGVHLVSTYDGVHQISIITPRSPARACNKLNEGDELIQVNYQTVIGWMPDKVTTMMYENPVEVILTVKKQPRHAPGATQIYFKPFRLPSKKRSYNHGFGAASDFTFRNNFTNNLTFYTFFDNTPSRSRPKPAVETRLIEVAPSPLVSVRPDTPERAISKRLCSPNNSIEGRQSTVSFVVSDDHAPSSLTVSAGDVLCVSPAPTSPDSTATLVASVDSTDQYGAVSLPPLSVCHTDAAVPSTISPSAGTLNPSLHNTSDVLADADDDCAFLSSDDDNEDDDAASTSASVRLYPPKPRAPVHRRATIPGDTAPSLAVTATLNQYIEGLRQSGFGVRALTRLTQPGSECLIRSNAASLDGRTRPHTTIGASSKLHPPKPRSDANGGPLSVSFDGTPVAGGESEHLLRVNTSIRPHLLTGDAVHTPPPLTAPASTTASNVALGSPAAEHTGFGQPLPLTITSPPTPLTPHPPASPLTPFSGGLYLSGRRVSEDRPKLDKSHSTPAYDFGADGGAVANSHFFVTSATADSSQDRNEVIVSGTEATATSSSKCLPAERRSKASESFVSVIDNSYDIKSTDDINSNEKSNLRLVSEESLCKASLQPKFVTGQLDVVSHSRNFLTVCTQECNPVKNASELCALSVPTVDKPPLTPLRERRTPGFLRPGNLVIGESATTFNFIASDVKASDPTMVLSTKTDVQPLEDKPSKNLPGTESICSASTSSELSSADIEVSVVEGSFVRDVSIPVSLEKQDSWDTELGPDSTATISNADDNSSICDSPENKTSIDNVLLSQNIGVTKLLGKENMLMEGISTESDQYEEQTLYKNMNLDVGDNHDTSFSNLSTSESSLFQNDDVKENASLLTPVDGEHYSKNSVYQLNGLDSNEIPPKESINDSFLATLQPVLNLLGMGSGRAASPGRRKPTLDFAWKKTCAPIRKEPIRGVARHKDSSSDLPEIQREKVHIYETASLEYSGIVSKRTSQRRSQSHGSQATDDGLVQGEERSPAEAEDSRAEVMTSKDTEKTNAPESASLSFSARMIDAFSATLPITRRFGRAKKTKSTEDRERAEFTCNSMEKLKNAEFKDDCRDCKVDIRPRDGKANAEGSSVILRRNRTVRRSVSVSPSLWRRGVLFGFRSNLHHQPHSLQKHPEDRWRPCKPSISSAHGAPVSSKGSSLTTRGVYGAGRGVSCHELGIGDHQGWLYRRACSSRTFLNSNVWQRRWFILKKGFLYGYTAPSALKAQSLIYLPGFHVCPAQDAKPKKYAFKIYHANGATFFFACDTGEERSRWMSEIGLSANPGRASSEHSGSGPSSPLSATANINEEAYYSETDEELEELKGPAPVLQRSESPGQEGSTVTCSGGGFASLFNWGASSSKPAAVSSSTSGAVPATTPSTSETLEVSSGGSRFAASALSQFLSASGKGGALKFLQPRQEQAVTTANSRSYRRVREFARSTSTNDLRQTQQCTGPEAPPESPLTPQVSVPHQLHTPNSAVTTTTANCSKIAVARKGSLREKLRSHLPSALSLDRRRKNLVGNDGKKSKKIFISNNSSEVEKITEKSKSESSIISLQESADCTVLEPIVINRDILGDSNRTNLSGIEEASSMEGSPKKHSVEVSPGENNENDPSVSLLAANQTNANKIIESSVTPLKCKLINSVAPHRGSLDCLPASATSTPFNSYRSDTRAERSWLATSSRGSPGDALSPITGGSVGRRRHPSPVARSVSCNAGGATNSSASNPTTPKYACPEMYTFAASTPYSFSATQVAFSKVEEFKQNYSERLKRTGNYRPVILRCSKESMKTAFVMGLDQPDKELSSSLGCSSSSDLISTPRGSHHRLTSSSTPNVRPQVPPRTKFLSTSERSHGDSTYSSTTDNSKSTGRFTASTSSVAQFSSLHSTTSLQSSSSRVREAVAVLHGVSKSQTLSRLDTVTTMSDEQDQHRAPLKPTMGISMIGKQRRTPGVLSPREVFFCSPPASPSYLTASPYQHQYLPHVTLASTTPSTTSLAPQNSFHAAVVSRASSMSSVLNTASSVRAHSKGMQSSRSGNLHGLATSVSANFHGNRSPIDGAERSRKSDVSTGGGYSSGSSSTASSIVVEADSNASSLSQCIGPDGKLMQVLPHYPDMEYPPIFEPGSYSLAASVANARSTGQTSQICDLDGNVSASSYKPPTPPTHMPRNPSRALYSNLPGHSSSSLPALPFTSDGHSSCTESEILGNNSSSGLRVPSSVIPKPSSSPRSMVVVGISCTGGATVVSDHHNIYVTSPLRPADTPRPRLDPPLSSSGATTCIVNSHASIHADCNRIELNVHAGVAAATSVGAPTNRASLASNTDTKSARFNRTPSPIDGRLPTKNKKSVAHGVSISQSNSSLESISEHGIVSSNEISDRFSAKGLTALESCSRRTSGGGLLLSADNVSTTSGVVYTSFHLSGSSGGTVLTQSSAIDHSGESVLTSCPIRLAPASLQEDAEGNDK